MPTVRWSCWSGCTATTALRSWHLSWFAPSLGLLCQIFSPELILLAATVVPLLLCPVELIVFAATVLLLLLVVFLELVDFAATAMPLLLVGLELISAFAATMTLVLLELLLSVVPLVRLLGCEVNVRWRRQVVVWLCVLSALHVTVIVLCLTSWTIDARCMRV